VAERELELTKTQLLDALADYLEVRGVGGCQGKFLEYVEQIHSGLFDGMDKPPKPKMVCGVWVGEGAALVTSLDAYKDHKRDILEENMKLVMVLCGDNWNVLMQKFHDYMGWEPYVPVEDLDECAD